MSKLIQLLATYFLIPLSEKLGKWFYNFVIKLPVKIATWWQERKEKKEIEKKAQEHEKNHNHDSFSNLP